MAGDDMTASSSSRFSGLLPRSALLVGTLIVLVLGAEILVRIAWPRPLPPHEFLRSFVLRDMYVPDEKAGYRPTPNFKGRIERLGYVTEFSTNSLGMRAPEVGPKSGPRILVFGDSFTWGWGVNQGDEWVSVLDRELGDAVEALNCGVNGYGTEGELRFLESIGQPLAPDLVLVGFFTNDYTDNLISAPSMYTIRNGYLFDQFSHDYYRDNVLARESHLYRLFGDAWENVRVKYLGGVPNAHPARRFTEGDFERGRDLSEMHLLTMRDRARAMNAAFGVVWVPADTYALSQAPSEGTRLRADLQSRIAAAGIPSIDLLPIIRGEANVSDLYLPNDGHFSTRGNAIAGRAIAKWVLDLGLIEPAE